MCKTVKWPKRERDERVRESKRARGQKDQEVRDHTRCYLLKIQMIKLINAPVFVM